MTHLLRGKQAGIQNDLSAGLSQDHIAIDDLARYGINSQTSALAYDPVQSLLAVGTKSSQFGPGQIYVFGRGRICATLPLARSGAAAQVLQFCADKLVCLDSKHDLSVYSLEAKRLLASHSPGIVTAIATDPAIDYCILGMQTGDLLAYDLDREGLAPFKVPNLWQEVEPKARIAGVQTLQFHPRDIGTLLIGFTQGAAIYDFKLNKARKFFHYEIPRGAPGGDGDPTASQTFRRPRLVQAVWHPTGTFILTGYEDSSLVFWDVAKDGRMLMARTLTDTNVATPGASGLMKSESGIFAVKEPIFRIAWCANGSDPDDSGVLIAGGGSTQSQAKGLTFLELGRTPVYNTATWESLAKHFESPKRQHLLPTPPGAEVIDFCLIPRSSPHFAGAHDPIAIIALMASGELITLSFPSGMPISPTNQLHPSISFVHPFLQRINVTPVERERWLGFTERRQHGPPILKGGAGAPRPMRRFENRNVVQTIHADGTIRIWDIGHGDEIENENMLQADVARAVNSGGGVRVTANSFAPASSEMAVGVQSGELVVFRWNRNRNAGREPPQPSKNEVGALTNVTERVEPSLSEGLLPFTLLNQGDGPVTAVKMSEVGFVAAGFVGGIIVVIDLRGPAIIYNESIHSLVQSSKRSSIRRSHSNSTGSQKSEYVTTLEFSVMTLENEDYSSILLHAGTNQGHLATFKVVPDPSGRYTAEYAGSVNLENRVIHIAPIQAETGKSALATQQAVGSLRSGQRTNGAIVAVTQSSAHIFRPATSKGAHKSFDSFFCDSATIGRYQDQGYALLGLFGDGNARAYSLPALREIGSAPAGNVLDVRRFGDAVITPQGTVVGFTGPSEIALLDLWGTGDSLVEGRSQDKIFNPEALIPPRPTISNVQWLTGTQYVTPADMDILIGGPDRPPSKRMVAQSRADEEKARAAGRANAAKGGSADEGYWACMQRQVQERTEKLGMMGDSMEQLEQNSSGWVNDVNKFVGKQKKGVATGLFKAKFGL